MKKLLMTLLGVLLAYQNVSAAVAECEFLVKQDGKLIWSASEELANQAITFEGPAEGQTKTFEFESPQGFKFQIELTNDTILSPAVTRTSSISYDDVFTNLPMDLFIRETNKGQHQSMHLSKKSEQQVLSADFYCIID